MAIMDSGHNSLAQSLSRVGLVLLSKIGLVLLCYGIVSKLFVQGSFTPVIHE